MRKFLLLVLVSTTFLNLTFSQKLKKVKNIDNRARTFESYYVLKDSSEMRYGEYVYKYKGNIQVQGQFENNYATGEWIYTPGDNLKIIGNFVENEKQGVWKYYSGDKLISVLNYEKGRSEGKSTGYYEKGQIACEVLYADNKIVGERKSYYENGQVKEISNYKNGKLDGVVEKFDENGKLLYKIIYKEKTPYDLEIVIDDENLFFGGDLKDGNGQFINYSKNHETGKKFVKLIRTFKDGKLYGQVIGYDHKGELFYRGQYMNGFMVGMWNFNLNNKKKRYDKAYNYADSLTTDTTKWFLNFHDNISEVGVKMPKFDNIDTDHFRLHIQSSLIYPFDAQKLGISGRIFVQFKVNKVGLVYDVKLVKKVDKLLDEEALRVIKSSPLWIPGFNDQLPVDVLFTFPIVFQLR
ncbi:MAG: TonB family protein [Bacteroidales bacterium]|nr:TonB family protein [Bacteroidales bacterium]